jgi:CDP-glucose 4,6-dehydratase
MDGGHGLTTTDTGVTASCTKTRGRTAPERSGDLEMARNAGPFGGAYKGLTVLVTGHTGFKGSWLSLWLSDLGAKVVGYALEPPTEPSAFVAMRLADRVTDVRGDVRDAEKLSAVLSEHRPDIVFHLAAQALVRPSYDEPRLTFETNVMGTVNLFEAVRACDSVRAVVNVTSDKCYENREWVYAYREIDPMGGFDPYSSSKGCAELVTSAYRRSFFSAEGAAKVASARAGNVIGGGDWAPDRLIPDCVRALTAGESVLVRNPGAVRPWQHVLEPISGYLWLGARLLAGDGGLAAAWNFGPEARGNMTVAEVVGEFVDFWGEGEWHSPAEQAASPHEATTLKLDVTKAADVLRWHPVWEIRRAVDATAEWYRAFADGKGDAALRTLDQIDDYVSEAARRGIDWALDGPAAE